MVSFENQRTAWSNPPVDDVGYISSEEMLEFSDAKLRKLVKNFEETRYGGWRNYNNMWRETFCLDEPGNDLVLDYGCGVGIEALQYAKMGHRVVLADIAEANLALARRVLHLHGYDAFASPLLGEKPPKNLISQKLDVIHCVGVLHHIPNAREVMEAFHEWMKKTGELRLMVYTNWAWLDATGRDAPSESASNRHFKRFVHAMDGVGEYADWYSLEKLEAHYGDIFKVKRWADLTANLHYLGVVLEKR